VARGSLSPLTVRVGWLLLAKGPRTTPRRRSAVRGRFEAFAGESGDWCRRVRVNVAPECCSRAGCQCGCGLALRSLLLGCRLPSSSGKPAAWSAMRGRFGASTGESGVWCRRVRVKVAPDGCSGAGCQCGCGLAAHCCGARRPRVFGVGAGRGLQAAVVVGETGRVVGRPGPLWGLCRGLGGPVSASPCQRGPGVLLAWGNQAPERRCLRENEARLPVRGQGTAVVG